VQTYPKSVGREADSVAGSHKLVISYFLNFNPARVVGRDTGSFDDFWHLSYISINPLYNLKYYNYFDNFLSPPTVT
jgi:hypothetical protein